MTVTVSPMAKNNPVLIGELGVGKTVIGGMAGPWLFGALIDTGSRTSLFGAYLLGAALMIAAGLIAAFLAVAAERKPLEEVARPLAFVD